MFGTLSWYTTPVSAVDSLLKGMRELPAGCSLSSVLCMPKLFSKQSSLELNETTKVLVYLWAKKKNQLFVCGNNSPSHDLAFQMKRYVQATKQKA